MDVSQYNEHDQVIWDEELSDFVPDRVFDAHIHLFNSAHYPPGNAAWSDQGLADIQQWAETLYPGRRTHFLALGSPLIGIDVAAHNAWLINEIQQDANSRLNRLVTPACTPDEISRDVEQAGVVGLKPYRIFALNGDAKECSIEQFLTHEQLEVADHYGLWVTMHLSKELACADPTNLADLREYTTSRYPNVKWILAHCARSFTYWPIRQAVSQLRDMPNIYYDLSAVDDLRPILTLFQQESLDRILYGSDGVDATYFRGKYVALGRAWQYLDAAEAGMRFPHCDARPILSVYEQLLCMKHAAEIAEFGQPEIDAIFWKNATELFNVTW